MHETVCIGDAVNWESSLNRGLVSWWLALPDQQRGNVFRDLCGRNHGTLTNGPTWQGARGRPGGFGSLELDGSNDYVSVPTTSAITSITDKFTVAFWVRPTVTGDADRRYVAIGGSNITIRYGFASVAFTTVNISGVGVTDFSSGMSINNWWHLVLVYDGAAYSLYVNGQQKGSTADSGNVDWSFAADTILGAASGGSNPMAGNMDDFMLFNVAQNPVQLYRESLAGYPNTLNWTRRPAYVEQGGGAAAFPWHYYQQLMAG